MPEHRGGHDPSTERRARPGYHDPTATIGGAVPARSALTLRLILAAVGLLACTAWAVGNAAVGGQAWLTAVLAVLALVALVDIVLMVRRKRRGEPG